MLKNKRGITLIGLVVTIIVIVVLAGVAISLVFRQDGIIEKGMFGITENKRGQYFEEIKMEIAGEQAERADKNKQEAFITSLAERLSPSKKEWVSSIVKCAEVDGSLEENEDDEDNNLLIITTKDSYEIIVSVINDVFMAELREDSYGKVGEECVVTYNSNAGEETVTGTVESQSIRKGFSIVTRENGFERSGYGFKGWSKYASGKNQAGEDELYSAGSKIRITENTTLYAIWEKLAVTITFDSNGGTGTMQPLTVGINEEIDLHVNEFERDGYAFAGWKDQDNKDYTDEQKIIASKDLQLTAQWIQYSIKSISLSVDDLISSSEMKINANIIFNEGASNIINSYKYYIYKGNNLITQTTTSEANWTAGGLTPGDTYTIYLLVSDANGLEYNAEIKNYTKKGVYSWNRYLAGSEVSGYKYEQLRLGTNTENDMSYVLKGQTYSVLSDLETCFDSSTGTWIGDSGSVTITGTSYTNVKNKILAYGDKAWVFGELNGYSKNGNKIWFTPRTWYGSYPEYTYYNSYTPVAGNPIKSNNPNEYPTEAGGGYKGGYWYEKIN